MPTRRHIVQGLAAASGAMVAGFDAPAPSARTPAAVLGKLSALMGRLPSAQAGVVLHVARGGEMLYAGSAGFAGGLDPIEPAQGAPRRPMKADTMVRVASVSKMAVALTAADVLARIGEGFEADAAKWLPGLRNPAFPERPITLAHLLAHTSSLRDPEAYWIAAPGRIETILQASPYGAQAPGTYFTYCNFNFGVLATILERMSGTRFDSLALQTLAGLGLPGGFNWSGVPRARREAGATLYRIVDGDWRIQTDGPDILAMADPLWLHEDGFTLAQYEVGSNGTLFSPQGGLRTDVATAARLAKTIAGRPDLARMVWRHDPQANNGDTLGGLYEASGLGCFEWRPESAPIRGQRMIGHDGEAYGLYSGAWWLPDMDAEIGFAITGTPQGEQPPSDHPGYNLWCKTLFDTAAGILGLGGKAPEAQP